MHPVGCAARVLKMLKFPDSTVRVLVEGLWRVRITNYTRLEPYLTASVELMKDETENSVELSAMLRNAQYAVSGDYQTFSRRLSEQIKVAALNTEDAGQLTDLIAVNLNLELAERQNLLEVVSVKERLARFAADAQPRARGIDAQLENTDRGGYVHFQDSTGFLLREQLRAIQRELGESDPNAE
jgi:ATP-dependent Lon protease